MKQPSPLAPDTHRTADHQPRISANVPLRRYLRALPFKIREFARGMRGAGFNRDQESGSIEECRRSGYLCTRCGGVCVMRWSLSSARERRCAGCRSPRDRCGNDRSRYRKSRFRHQRAGVLQVIAGTFHSVNCSHNAPKVPSNHLPVSFTRLATMCIGDTKTSVCLSPGCDR